MGMDQSPLLSKRVNLIRCELATPALTKTSAGREVADIRSAVKSLTIYENLFMPSITGTLVLQDDVSLSTVAGLTGMDMLLVAFSVRDWRNGTERHYGTWDNPLRFNIFAQRNRIPVTMGTEQYTLKLAAPEMLASSEVRISRAYADQRVEDIIRDILANDVGSKKTLVHLETTASPTSLVLPFVNPLEAIRLLTFMAHSPKGDTNYVFYETLDGYNFRSVRHMLEEELTARIPTITQGLAGTKDAMSTPDLLFADAIDLVQGFDFLHLLSEGYFASTTYRVDVLDGSWEAVETNLSDELSRGRPLTNGPKSRPLYPYELGHLSFPTAKLFVIPTTKHALTNPALAADVKIRDNYLADTLPIRNRELLGLQMRTIRARVAGAPELHVGKLVNVVMPTPLTIGRPGGGVVDVASGKYLIVAAQHSIINNGVGDFLYETTLEAGTNSLAV